MSEFRIAIDKTAIRKREQSTRIFFVGLFLALGAMAVFALGTARSAHLSSGTLPTASAVG